MRICGFGARAESETLPILQSTITLLGIHPSLSTDESPRALLLTPADAGHANPTQTPSLQSHIQPRYPFIPLSPTRLPSSIITSVLPNTSHPPRRPSGTRQLPHRSHPSRRLGHRCLTFRIRATRPASRLSSFPPVRRHHSRGPVHGPFRNGTRHR